MTLESKNEEFRMDAIRRHEESLRVREIERSVQHHASTIALIEHLVLKIRKMEKAEARFVKENASKPAKIAERAQLLESLRQQNRKEHEHRDKIERELIEALVANPNYLKNR